MHVLKIIQPVHTYDLDLMWAINHLIILQKQSTEYKCMKNKNDGNI